MDNYDFLDPSNEVIFFILDNHRPVNVTNIHNETQVKIGSDSACDVCISFVYRSDF